MSGAALPAPIIIASMMALLMLQVTQGAVVGLTADLEMWPEDSKYLNVTATAAAMVRNSNLTGLVRYSVAADITLVYETTVWNGSLSARTSPRPYHQAIMDQVDEVLVMDYGQTTRGGLCSPSTPRCAIAKPLWWTGPWLAYAESLRRISDGRRQVLVTMGLPVDAGPVGTPRGWFTSEQQLETFIGEVTSWSVDSGFTPAGSCANVTGWQPQYGGAVGPFHKTAVFMAQLYQNVTATRPCPPGAACPPVGKRQPRGLWTYQNTADPMVYGPGSMAYTTHFLAWCREHGVDELYLFPARIRGCSPSPTWANATTEAALATFVRTADAAGVSVQLFVGPNKDWVDRVCACVEASLRFIQRENLYAQMAAPPSSTSSRPAKQQPPEPAAAASSSSSLVRSDDAQQTQPWWSTDSGRRRHVSFWYWPGAYGGTEINASLASLARHPGVVRSVLLSCGLGVSNESAGITVDPRGSPRNSSAICQHGQFGARQGLIARLKAMRVVPELVLSNGFVCSNHSNPQGGSCVEEADVADYRAFMGNATANIAEMVRLGQEWGTGGWHFDLEPVRSGSTRADAALYAQFLSKARKAFTAAGMRTSVSTARWTPFLGQYAALAGAADVLMSMETYQAGSFEGWMKQDSYGGDYTALLQAAGPSHISPGFACSAGSGAPPPRTNHDNESGPASWNGTLCGAAACWSDSPASWAQRLQQMKRDGVREASVFMLNHRRGTWQCPNGEEFWRTLEDFVRP